MASVGDDCWAELVPVSEEEERGEGKLCLWSLMLVLEWNTGVCRELGMELAVSAGTPVLRCLVSTVTLEVGVNAVLATEIGFMLGNVSGEME